MTTIRVRAIPVGAAIRLTRRALAIGPRVTLPAIHGLMAEWWSVSDYCGDNCGSWTGDYSHPFTSALRTLENAPLT